MPVRVWEMGADGLVSKILTQWDTRFTAEERRPDAEGLDEQLDEVLDRALAQAEGARAQYPGASSQFVSAWALGRSLNSSHVFEAKALRDEPREWLWLAMARKCRLGARADGSLQPAWAGLRPSSAREPVRRPDGHGLDYFEMCRWLSEQELGEAIATFGGSVNNAWQMLERPALASMNLRRALLDWLRAVPEGERSRLTERQAYRDLMKTLRTRWPARGLGSARRPEHYPDEELAIVLRETLQGFRSRYAG